jgi:hypothetical protein
LHTLQRTVLGFFEGAPIGRSLGGGLGESGLEETEQSGGGASQMTGQMTAQAAGTRTKMYIAIIDLVPLSLYLIFMSICQLLKHLLDQG